MIQGTILHRLFHFFLALNLSLGLVDMATLDNNTICQGHTILNADYLSSFTI